MLRIRTIAGARTLWYLTPALLLVGAAVAAIGISARDAAGAGTKPAGAPSSTGAATRTAVVAIPAIDAERGSRLFVTKGCVICHSINGVGGKAGPSLDASDETGVIDVFDFAARMWAGSFAMIELQGMELGYQLEISGEELAHIAGFVYDRKAQQRFRQSDVPDLIKDMIIREPYEPGKGLDDPRQ